MTKLKYIIIRLLMPLVRLYWRVVKPQTYGVRALIVNQRGECLLVRHTYGNQQLWNIPGGGYSPKRESALAAIKREVREELGIDITEFTFLGTYETSGEGKKDSVSLFSATLSESSLSVGDEIAEYAWTALEIAMPRDDIARVARRSISTYLK